jgi:transcriptional regulator with XRE-family HTH domain
MNISKIEMLMAASKLNKVQIAEQCGVSRTTLDNVLAGADVKISTIESLAKVLKVSAASFFEDDMNITKLDNNTIDMYKKEIERLQSLLDKQKKSTKVVVELDVDDDEFIKLGLKDKVLQILNK